MVQHVLSESQKPIIAVCGARGNQGSSVIQALLTFTEFAIRAVIRHSPDAIEVKSYATRGIEVVQADYDHPDTLLKAFEGCYGVFGVTNWYEAGEHVVQQGKNIVDAAKRCGVKHFVWSSGPDTNGVLTSFSSKAMVARHLESSGMPYTSILIPIYYDSIMLLVDKKSTGGFSLNSGFPIDSSCPFVEVSDIGIWVANVFNESGEWINKTIAPCTEWLTPREQAQTLMEASNEECYVAPVTVEEFLSSEIPNESLREEKIGMEFILRSYDNKVWSTSLGRHLNPQPKLWKDVCEERFRDNETLIQSPIEGSMAIHQVLDVQVTKDYESPM
ncbi:hypothetical protein FRC02_001882 [Tulasnella sp. 418]|nr:hypothetical protein FRC02_001882 [Tulasnella sp. 418]